jgi:hypothetical protein
MEAGSEKAAGVAADRPVKRTPDGRFSDPGYYGFKPGQSGNPAGHRGLKDQADAMFEQMLADLGPLSPTDMILLKQACLMLANAARIPGRSRPEVDVAVRLHSEARRSIASLRKHIAEKAKQPTETFADIADRAQQAAAERRATAEAERTTDDPNAIADVSSDEGLGE